MNEVKFLIPVLPPKATAQSTTRITFTKNGKPLPIKNKRGKQVEQDLLVLLLDKAPPAPLEGPLAIELAFTYPWRKSEPKWRLALGCVPMTTAPDLDNLCKLFFDAMAKALYYNNDSQLSWISVRKFWGDQPSISLHLRELEQGRKKN